jgi:hypothetical protein
LSTNFYKESVIALEKQIEENPGDIRFIRLQLDHYEKLGWPKEASRAVVRALPLVKEDPVMLDQSLEFYRVNRMHEALLQLIETQEEHIILPRSVIRQKIMALAVLGLHDESKMLLGEYLDKAEPGDQLFAGSVYLEIEDSILSSYHFIQSLREDGPSEELIWICLPVWHAHGIYQAVIELGMPFKEKLNNVQRVLLADAHYQSGNTSQAKKLLWSTDLWQANVLLSDWFVEEVEWDSAHLALEKEGVSDTKRVEVLMRHGGIDQARGWFTSSLTYYEQVLAMDSTYQEAQKEVEIVHQKIAYLRRIREMQREIPTLNLSSKKISN